MKIQLSILVFFGVTIGTIAWVFGQPAPGACIALKTKVDEAQASARLWWWFLRLTGPVQGYLPCLVGATSDAEHVAGITHAATMSQVVQPIMTVELS
jgi:hypothetical protein